METMLVMKMNVEQVNTSGLQGSEWMRAGWTGRTGERRLDCVMNALENRWMVGISTEYLLCVLYSKYHVRSTGERRMRYRTMYPAIRLRIRSTVFYPNGTSTERKSHDPL